MIGFYDYTVILTYISFASSISGIFLATRGHFNWAIFCLAFSGLCDMFDGKLRGRRKTGPKMKSGSAFRSIRSAMWFVSASFRSCSAMSLA